MTHSCAFLSTPSIYFSLPVEIRQQCKLFDVRSNTSFQDDINTVQYDTKFNTDSGFVQFDFNVPQNIPEELHHTFDMVVIDPPFITLEVYCYTVRINRASI